MHNTFTTLTTYVLWCLTIYLSWNTFKIWYVIRDDSYLDLIEALWYDREEARYWSPKIYYGLLGLSILSVCALVAWISLP